MATRTVATKLQIDGEAEYKKSLKNINSELGALKSELKLVESEFAGQANSYDALKAKGDALEKIYAQQTKKLEAHTAALESANKAQEDTAKAIDDAKKELAEYESALAALAEESGDTSEEQERLTQNIKDTQAALAKLEGNYEQATRLANSYQSQVNSAKAELNKLDAEIEKNAEYLDEAARSSDGCAKSIDEYGKEVAEAAEETESFSDKLKSGLAGGAKIAAAGIAAVGAAAVAGVKFLLDLEESTEEYRIAQGKLNTAFQAAGMDTNTAGAAYKSFFAILGDTDSATESAQLLAQLAKSEEDVAKWADIAAGVTGTFGDALPINSLIEASNETAKVGTVTGALADALNWVGISEDEFNEKLAACANEEERTALITETLASTYQSATDAFKENNETVIAAREAQAELDDALAKLGGTVANVKTGLTAEFMPAIAGVVDAFSDLLNGTEGAEEALAQAIDELVAQAADKLPELLDFGTQIVLSLVGGIANAAPSLMEGAVSAVMTLIEGLVSALPLILEAAVQVVATLVQGIGEALPTLIPAAVAAITQLVQSLIENIPLLVEAALALVTGLTEGIIAAIPVLLEALPKLIESLVTTLLKSTPKITKTGVTLITALVDNLPQIIKTIIAVAPKIIESVVSTLLDHLPEIVEAGFELITALVENLPEIITTIVSALPEIVLNIVQTLVDSIPQIVDTGVTLLTALITNLPQIISEIVWAMPEIISGMISALMEAIPQFESVGGDLVRGLWQGIQSLAGWLWSKVSSWISDIWDGITDFFGIASPSKKMAWVSEMNVEGAVVGIEKNKGKAVNAYGKMGEEMLAEVESGLGKIDAELTSSIGEIETGFSAKATVEAVAASLPSDLSESHGGRSTSGGGDTTVTNHFHIGSMVVREEADVKRVARELYNMQKTKSRGKGVVMA